MFKRNVTMHFEGIEDCTICYSIVSVTDRSLPSKQCRTCKNKYHASCLYKVKHIFIVLTPYADRALMFLDNCSGSAAPILPVVHYVEPCFKGNIFNTMSNKIRCISYQSQ